MSYYKVVKPKNKYGAKVLCAVLVILFITFIVSLYFRQICYPNAMTVCQAEVQALSVKCVNNAVISVVGNNQKLDEIVQIERDEQNRIMSVRFDSSQINNIATQISLSVQQEINDINEFEIAIPIGTLSHSPMLVGWGPDVVFVVNPISSVLCTITTDFVSCGINQTLQRVYVEVETKVEVAIPLMSSTVETTTPVLLSETLIVGQVPDTYLSGITLGSSS
ncbi:MAG: sporulation protein YunB [Clostridia bacterium]|nr:sporulation protein YunB [Clostridia bacterium]